MSEQRVELAEPFTCVEPGRYAPVHGSGGWRLERTGSPHNGFALEPGATVTAVFLDAHRLEVTVPAPVLGRQILDARMDGNDAGAHTVREFLLELLKAALDFKAPFGNSGWIYDLYTALADGGFLHVQRNQAGLVNWTDADEQAARRLIDQAVRALGDPDTDAGAV